jgi:hypothetical protein
MWHEWGRREMPIGYGKKTRKKEASRKKNMWVDDLGEVGWGGVDCIGLARDKEKWRALVIAVINLQVP